LWDVWKTFVGLFLIFLQVIKSTFWPLGCAKLTHRGNDVSDVFYTPPAASLTDSSKKGAPFFIVSPNKLTIMLIVTSGLYGIYWCFKNWSLYKAYSGRSIWPPARTLFALFYLPSLFYKVDGLLKAEGKGAMPYWAASGAGMILLAFVPQAIGFVTGFIQALRGETFTGFGVITVLMISIVPLSLQCLILRRVQTFMNQLNDDLDARQNSGFTVWDRVWMFIGVIYWAVGLFSATTMNSALQ
jgi:hypothetical protein